VKASKNELLGKGAGLLLTMSFVEPMFCVKMMVVAFNHVFFL
jgi:hypothetical protein